MFKFSVGEFWAVVVLMSTATGHVEATQSKLPQPSIIIPSQPVPSPVALPSPQLQPASLSLEPAAVASEPQTSESLSHQVVYSYEPTSILQTSSPPFSEISAYETAPTGRRQQPHLHLHLHPPETTFGDESVLIEWNFDVLFDDEISCVLKSDGISIEERCIDYSYLSSFYVWRNLTNGREYKFSVAIVGENGVGLYSNWSLPVVPATVPSEPTDLHVTVNISSLAALITWKHPNSTGGAPVNRYHIHEESRNITKTTTFNINDSLEYNWTNLSVNENYSFQIAADNLAGVGPYSITSELVTLSQTLSEESEESTTVSLPEEEKIDSVTTLKGEGEGEREERDPEVVVEHHHYHAKNSRFLINVSVGVVLSLLVILLVCVVVVLYWRWRRHLKKDKPSSEPEDYSIFCHIPAGCVFSAQELEIRLSEPHFQLLQKVKFLVKNNIDEVAEYIDIDGPFIIFQRFGTKHESIEKCWGKVREIVQEFLRPGVDNSVIVICLKFSTDECVEPELLPEFADYVFTFHFIPTKSLAPDMLVESEDNRQELKFFAETLNGFIKLAE